MVCYDRQGDRADSQKDIFELPSDNGYGAAAGGKNHPRADGFSGPHLCLAGRPGASKICSGLESNLYFWRNSSGNEIDVILDWGETCVPVEIKSAKTVASDFFEGINYWRNLAGDAQQPAALVYGGDMTLRRSDVCVCSWQVL
jgi:hypothetical protein